ncbi:MAG: hypothetical protein JWL63_3378 [Rhodocyclales bacterium]|nr:hypothetical protein [Rhodocyclales bacterium]
MNKLNKIIYVPYVWFPAVLGMLFGFLFDDKFRQAIGFDFYLSMISQVFPVIEKIKYANDFGSASSAFLGVVFPGVVFQLIIIGSFWKKNCMDNELIVYWRLFPVFKRLLVIVFSPLIVVGAAVGVFFLADDPSFCKGCTSSRFGFILINTLTPLAFSVVFLIEFSVLKNLRKIISKNLN